MENSILAAEQIALFCRLNINTKRELPIRSSEMGLLIYLSSTPEACSPADAKQFFNVSKAMITNMVSSLFRKGYLIKTTSSLDRRRIQLQLTEKAEQLIADTHSEYFKTMSVLQNKMGDADFNTLVALLESANVILLEEKKHG